MNEKLIFKWYVLIKLEKLQYPMLKDNVSLDYVIYKELLFLVRQTQGCSSWFKIKVYKLDSYTYYLIHIAGTLKTKNIMKSYLGELYYFNFIRGWE